MSEPFSWISPSGMTSLDVSPYEGGVWLEATNYAYEGDQTCFCPLTAEDARKLRDALDKILGDGQAAPK